MADLVYLSERARACRDLAAQESEAEVAFSLHALADDYDRQVAVAMERPTLSPAALDDQRAR